MPSIAAMTVALSMKVEKVCLSKKRGIGCWRIIGSIPGHVVLDWIILHSSGQTHIFRHDEENCPR